MRRLVRSLVEHRRAVLAIVAALLVAAAPLGAQVTDTAALPSVTLPPALERVLRDYERAWMGRDPAALAGLFTEDGFVLANGRPPVRGRAAIRAAYANAGGPLSLRALGFAVADTVGYIVGGYTGERGRPDGGKFVLALRRTRGGPWRIAADIDNPNERPQRPPISP